MPDGSGAATGIIAPVGYTVWPTTAELEAFLVAAGLTLSAEQLDELDTNLAASIRDLESLTGRQFLATAGTRRFNPPTGTQTLLLDLDLAALESIEYTPEGETPELLVQGADYTLEPWDAPERLVPYDAIVFEDARQWSYPLPLAQRGSLYVEGTWGYGLTIPPNVWSAVLARAGWLLSPLLGYGLSGGVKSVAQADTRVEYQDDRLASLKKDWGGAWGAMLAGYTRVARVAPPAIRPYAAGTTAAGTGPDLFGVAPARTRRDWWR